MTDPVRTVCSFLLAFLMLPALASAGGSSPAQRPVPAGEIGWRAHLAAAASGRGGGEALSHALRGSLEELAGISLPDPGAAEADEESLWDWGWLGAAPAGDLDADGQEDALEYVYLEAFEETPDDFTYLFEERTSAVRATDGQTLWTSSTTSEWSYLVPAGDLDGQPGDDLLRFTIAEAAVPATYLWLVGVSGVRGSDGSVLWTRTYPNPFTELVAGPTYGYVDVDYAVPLQLAGDVDGDGTRDMLVGRYSFAGVWDEGTEESLSQGSTVFEFLSGRTGAPVSVTPAADPWMDAAAIPDADGDGLDDLATVQAPWNGTQGTVAVRSGRTGGPIWSADIEIPIYAYTFVETAELSGDGRGDVLVRSYPEVIDDWDWYFGPQRVQALSGANGAGLWSTDLPAFTGLLATGDASGDGGSDLLTFPRDDSWAPPHVRSAHLYPDFQMTAGSDGGMVWGRSPQRLNRAVSAGDLDGDGVLDVLATTRRSGRQPLMRAFGGPGGGSLWMFGRPANTRQSRLGADLDGDGGDDLRDVKGSRYRIRRGSTAGPLWGFRSVAGWLEGVTVAERVGGGPGVLLESSGMERTLMLTGRSAAGQQLWVRSLDY